MSGYPSAKVLNWGSVQPTSIWINRFKLTKKGGFVNCFKYKRIPDACPGCCGLEIEQCIDIPGLDGKLSFGFAIGAILPQYAGQIYRKTLCTMRQVRESIAS